MKRQSTMIACALAAVSGVLLCLSGCNQSPEVVIYSNADEESRLAMQDALDRAGFSGQYIFSSFSTSELGGKIMAEGGNIEADVITASTYYLESAQQGHRMFAPLSFTFHTLEKTPDFCAPLTAQEGAIFINTKVLQENGLPRPASLKDLASPAYKGFISIPHIRSSSTAWLMVQALASAYGEQEAGRLLRGIAENAGPHLENSGSGPLKKVRAGEVAIAFGLRHQAVADRKAGLPIDYVDPTEGNFMLTESVCVTDKGAGTNPLAMRMAETLVRSARPGILKVYPVPLYEGEDSGEDARSSNVKAFPEPLTVDLLKRHQALMN